MNTQLPEPPVQSTTDSRTTADAKQIEPKAETGIGMPPPTFPEKRSE
jgi:hypothetical protein